MTTGVDPTTAAKFVSPTKIMRLPLTVGLMPIVAIKIKSLSISATAMASPKLCLKQIPPTSQCSNWQRNLAGNLSLLFEVRFESACPVKKIAIMPPASSSYLLWN